ncbi:type II toxin-antitoxin system RelE/ParE family toxin [Rhizobium oryzicola]|uniref:Type II toxin-antitoxin system RelE/ParE family toxin n=1 Tax=Rhizobium oryzicola TaxID=1232668 RepID=A0ABT8T2R2_9HYPH|nr:type II toxin-antitoxin system RelE/ParE family toxin [Rhizobium oryzicola]MDO1584466.1 type II toxin-antitoxin system RelE/ParE family toxin [Rhizobium oryzicola]
MVKLSVRWTRRALRRIDEIGAYVADDNPSAAARVVSRLIAVGEGLANHPFRGRIGRVEQTRELVVHGLPYVIVYTLEQDHIAVVTVLHTSRKWPRKF